MKKIISNVLSKFRKNKCVLTLLRKENHEYGEFVALNKRTSDSYCYERERKLREMFTSLSQ